MSVEGNSASNRPKNSSLAWENAVRDGRASFDFVFAALYTQYDGDQDSRQRAIELYPRLLDAFWGTHGAVQRSFFADGIRAAAVLCRAECELDARRDGSPGQIRARGRRARDATRSTRHRATAGAEPSDYHLFWIIWWDTVRFDAEAAKALAARLDLLRARIHKNLDGTADHAVCVQFLYGIVIDLIASIHREHLASRFRRDAPSPRHLEEIRRLEQRADDAELAYDASAQRVAQERYLHGAVAGSGAVLSFAAATHCVLVLLATNQVWAATAAAGCAGGILSVMNRLSRGRMALNYDADPGVLFRTGALRPVAGALLGIASYLLLAGPLAMTIQAPGEFTARLLFFAGFAFAAGFSERLVQDMLVGTARIAGGSARADDDQGTDAGRRSSSAATA